MIGEGNIVIDTIGLPDFAGKSDPKYIVLIQSIREAIRSGRLKPGTKMPPVRELAWEFGITPGTVARAYKLATDEGLVEAAVGRGTFVTGAPQLAPPPPEPLIGLAQTDLLDFRAARVPEVGQSAAIRTVLRQLGQMQDAPYLDYPTSQTDLAARQQVVRWIGPERAGRLVADDIVLGLGAQNTVMMALQACLHGASPVVLTEGLAYPGVRHAARLLRAQLIGVEIDQEGLRPDRLEEALRRHGGQVLLLSPHAHSPTTARMSLERRQRIGDIARRYQLQIIEDDCHVINRPDMPTFRAICPERGWLVSSLTKSVSAALRFGFAACPAEQASTARQVAQSTFYGLPQPVLDLCAELIRSGEAERIRDLVEREVAHRVQIAVNILGQWDIKWRTDVSFVWLRLPQGWRGSTFAMACEAEGLRIKPADEFAPPDGAAPHAVRLTLNAIAEQSALEDGLRRISALLSRPPVNVDF
ncbi:PLP-dependent aminotransferase family protein [Pseudohalocynthiibacter aestuariivivens]|uniref:PLP-dependent aminotransferase family protein n=1 Tax=Roseovarius pelagicus TaxID=2980108 RepID=A0ABY6DFE5_9RHOB|nr:MULTISPECIES: PLP-dependent aminotransferase family protein [Rhodobacterales]QIE44385.1 PLP-dependent aminotransferase family protein [Pseudohalocynthiibacter aestuariivivens]UXX83698.1 PLP-dependent aminotransferase family protein [Roseovarius pelagicus]